MIVFLANACMPVCAVPETAEMVPEEAYVETAAQEEPLSLEDCYKLALKQSEHIAINADLIKETEAHFLQALSIMVPHVSFLSLDMQEEEPAPGTTATFSSLKPSRSSTRSFNVTQTLFNGFKAIAAIRGSNFEKKQRVDEKIRAEQLLFVDVADAFYLLSEKKEDIRALQKIKAALISRIRELHGREKLGRSRVSEVVNAKVQLYSTDAAIQNVRNQEVLARQLLEFLVGRPVKEIVDLHNLPTFLQPEDHYLSKAYTRPDVEAARYEWQVAEMRSDVVDSDFLPVVSLESNYYVQRTGFDKGTDWDVMLNITVPIFEGTETLGNSKEAALKAHESKLEFQHTKRRAVYDIKDSYARLSTAMAIQDALRKAFKSAKLNYSLQRKDYELSLVNNLDVLAAIQSLRDAERNYIHALYETKRLYWQLLVAIGEGIPENNHASF